MAHVDALSRIVNYVEPMPLEKELEFKQLQDLKLKSIAENLEFSDNKKFQLIEGLVFKKCSDKPRFVIPESMVTNIIRIYHENMGHCGAEKTFQGLSANYWFPSLRKRIQDHIDNCIVCLMTNSATNSREGEMQITDSPTIPFYIIHTDHFGPLKESRDGFKHVLLVVDAFTRFTCFFPVRSTGSKEVIKHFTWLFQIFGNPSVVVSDRGTAFTSRELRISVF